MKKIIFFIILLILSFGINNEVWANKTSWSIIQSITIKKINLIEKYIIEHKRKIELFAKKYNVINDKELNSHLRDLSDIIKILWKLKTWNYNKVDINEVILKIVKKLRKINDELKNLLKEKKELFEEQLKNKALSYSKLWKKVSLWLNNLIKKIAIITKNKNIEKSKKKQILVHLRKLELYSNNLKNFINIEFSNEKELKVWFIEILKNIKIEMIWIKNRFGM